MTSSSCVGRSRDLLRRTERLADAAPGMVFVRNGRAEQCEDAVASTLHVAIIVAGHIDHYFQRRVDDRARLLGVEVLDKVHRALDVGEQHGDRLALALEVFWGRSLCYPN